MKNAVFEEHGVARLQAEVAYFHLRWVHLALLNSQGFSSKVSSTSHHSHAAIRLLKIRQTVTDFNAHQRQALMSQVPGDPNIAVPPASKGCGLRIFRSFVDERSRVKVNIGAE